jgi:SNF2 family DNA or RNA helicase
VDLERADPDRSLWNLETGTGNYFAYGVLVHNCHLITNQHAHQTAAVQRIAQHAATFLAASGTFVTRNAKDAYPVLEAMDRRSFPAGERYTARYCKTSGADYENETIDGLDPLAEPELRAVLAGQMHRFAKADVLDQLPPKIYSVRRPEIPAEWRSAYDQMEQLWLAELPDGDVELSAMDTLTRLTRLSQLASSAADVRIEYVWDERAGAEVPKQIVTLRAPSWKAESLTGILAERPDQPTAVFTESRPLALITGQYCEKAGLRTGYIVGKSSGPEDDAYGPGYRITDATRQAARDGFQAGKLDVIICTAGAGGTGITLTAANCAVMLQRSWQYDLGIQVEDRIHRIGAEIHAHVEIIDIVAQGTVDERRREILREKAGHAAEWAQDPRLVRQILGGLK